MGKEKYLKSVENLFRKSPVVSYSSIQRIIKGNKGNNVYAKQLVRQLMLKGKIKKLAKGCYTSRNDSQLIIFYLKPAYLGLQDALSFHGLWEQETVPIIVTVRKVRQGLRKVLGSNILIRRINKRYLFGFDYIQQGEIYYPYSDIEKTLIDMIYFNEKLSKEALNNIPKKIDAEKLKGYLKKYPTRFQKKVLKLVN